MEQLTNEREAAKRLFFQAKLTQAEIAASLNIGERTLSRWINEGQWRAMRLAARTMPSHLVDNCYLQIAELQESIMSRPQGQRYATEQEAAIISRLVLSLTRLKGEVTRANNIETMLKFLDLVMVEDPTMIKPVAELANKYIMGARKRGIAPYSMEYNTGMDEEDFLNVALNSYRQPPPYPANDKNPPQAPSA